jgi:hypothetical protein
MLSMLYMLLSVTKLNNPKMQTRRFFRSNQPYAFTWFVPERGFEVGSTFETDLNSGQSASKPSVFLIDREPIGASKAMPYFPLREKTGLFRTFAALTLIDENILEFANGHGPLGPMIAKTVIPPGSKRGELNPFHYAEPLAAWREQISLMKWLVRVWDALRNDDHAFLRRFIEWKQGSAIAHFDASLDCPVAHGCEVIVGPDTDPRIRRKLKAGDLTDPACLYLQRSINKQLTQFPSQIRLLWDNSDSALFIEPTGLVGALWLQLALGIDGNRQYQVCGQCRQWFETGGGQKRAIGADHHRADADFCSDACRQKAYRIRNGQKKK